MSRRHKAEKREILPDPKFGNAVVTKFNVVPALWIVIMTVVH